MKNKTKRNSKTQEKITQQFLVVVQNTSRSAKHIHTHTHTEILCGFQNVANLWPKQRRQSGAAVRGGSAGRQLGV